MWYTKIVLKCTMVELYTKKEGSTKESSLLLKIYGLILTMRTVKSMTDTENNVKASDIEVVKRDGKFYVLKGHDAVKTAVEQGKNLVAIKAMFE